MTTQNTTISPIFDGDSLEIMLALRNRYALSAAELKNLVASKYESDQRFEQALDYTGSKGWTEIENDQISLTAAGINWLDAQQNELTTEIEDSESQDQAKIPYDVAKLKMETKYLSVFQALRKVEKGEIILNPDFQRAFVWDDTRQSRLIESLLIRIPLPAFYIDATDQVSWNVVDGLQRLSTLVRYCRKQEFQLCNLQFLSELEGMRFDDLPKQYQVLIEDDTQLLFYNLMPGTPVLAKYTIFSRVNTGGMQLTPQEIRHALSQGKSTELLLRLSRNETFRKIMNGAIESSRMSDRELILRSLAFMQLGTEGYKKYNEFDRFLLSAMHEFNSYPDEKLDALASTFIDSLKKVEAIFGKYSFRKFSGIGGRRAPLNKALFEAWTVNVVEYDHATLIANRDKIISNFLKLLVPWGGFTRSISSSTGSIQAVNTRFSEIKKLLAETIS